MVEAPELAAIWICDDTKLRKGWIETHKAMAMWMVEALGIASKRWRASPRGPNVQRVQ